ncbi:MAG: sodium/glutamate symporter [Desulfuromonadales bacterium]|jgi:ESS family glutamate:Na+ symporter|nr:sodium/glutamate symporter [Desulfuromonadales bacterium]
MGSYHIEAFLAFTIAIILLFLGKFTIGRFELLKRYSVPEPVVGGFLCAAAVGLSYYLFNFEISFNLEVRDFLLLYFFAAIGLQTDIRTLLTGGRPLAILLTLATVFIILQNLVGMSIATLFDMDAKTGLLVGSISLVGGVGTALAWAPTFVDSLNISNALEIGVAANTVGLIAACLVGGPIARFLIVRHNIESKESGSLDIGVSRDTEHRTMVDSYALLWSWLWLNVCIIFGYLLDQLLESIEFQLPMFVSCLMAGILIGNCRNLILKREEAYPGARLGIALFSDISLGLFLTMALMGLQIWELQGLVAFISSVMFCQILLSVLFTVLIVYRLMGKDYEATVICAGFGGITLGSTATAIVNMSAVAKQYGPAHRAFIIVPLVCGFFIDIVNALIIGFFVGL